jgi:hypothetical protein
VNKKKDRKFSSESPQKISLLTSLKKFNVVVVVVDAVVVAVVVVI